jgi:ABC-type sugar transport system ATPase subunit
MTATDVLIGARSVTVDYSGTRALDEVTVTVRRGEIVAVVGANGSGKTTLLNVLTGQRSPTSGEIRDGDGPVVLDGPAAALRRSIVLVPQEPLHAPTLTVWENLLLGESRLAGRGPGRRERRAARDHVRRTLPHIDPDDSVDNLRKADRALLSLERAMRRRPTILALDEPTAVLGEQGVALVESAARSVIAEGGAVILVSHRLADIMRLASRVVVLVDGRVVMDRPVGEISVPDIVDTIAAGRDVQRHEDDAVLRTAEPGERLLTVTTTRADSGLDIDSLEIRAGEIVGLAGMAGSGRSRLCRIAAGVGPRYDGVRYRGRRLPPSVRAARRAGIAFIPEDRRHDGVFPTLSVERNIEIGDVVRSSLGHIWPMRPARAKTDAVISGFGIKTPSPAAEITVLSGGNAQRVVVARELMNGPALIVADEPTQGVDQAGRTAIHAMLRDFARRGGGVLVVSSEFEELKELADRIHVLVDGRMVAERPADVPYAELVALASGVQPAIANETGDS